MIIYKDIYFLECGYPNAAHGSCPACLNIEDYLRGKLWIGIRANIFLHHRGEHYSISGVSSVEQGSQKVIINRNKTRQTLLKFKVSVIKDWGYRPVFVGVIQISKCGEQLQLRSLPSVIWLKIIKNRVNTPNLCVKSLSSSLPIFATSVKDRKFAPIVINRTGAMTFEFKDNVIKGTSQVMSEVSHHQSPRLGKSSIPFNEIYQIIPDIVFRDGVWVALKETPKATLEIIQVKLRSPRLQPWLVQGVHNYNRDYTA
jgi:hypothetical protein